MKKINKLLVIYIITIISVNCSCKKYLDIQAPKDKATPSEIFANDASATAAITGIYSRMQSLAGGYSGGQNSISVISGLSADEFKSYSTTLDVFYKNEIPTSNSIINNNIWSESYRYIYTANAVLEGLKSAPGVSLNTNKQLEGEAKFIRAFCYFYLVNLFGEVPLNLTSNLASSRFNKKSTVQQVYTQIVIDLTDAENLLSADYVSSERVRPNKWAASSLLSRVYLYNDKWDLAIEKATAVISQTEKYALTELNSVFLKNSKETIWQLMPEAGFNTKDGALFILTTTPTAVSVPLNLIQLFDIDDNRKNQWIGQFTNSTGTYFYPYKYKIRTPTNGVINEYMMVIRLAELYLVRAEANANLNNLSIALDDINQIRKRAGMTTPLADINQNQCLTEIAKQRQLELFSEWGHRWLDLKRTGRASLVLEPLKGVTWKESDILYPIPDAEINQNFNMVQNFGY